MGTTVANPQGQSCPWNEIDPFLQGEISAKIRPSRSKKRYRFEVISTELLEC